jgi:hypothetical protein
MPTLASGIIVPQHLCITSSLLILPLIYYLAYSSKNVSETILTGWLASTIIAAQLFWYNPVRGSLIHRIDGVIAKVTAISFVTYTIHCKNLSTPVFITYINLISGIGITAWYSNIHSRRQWCCQTHLMIHGGLHICCFLSAFYAYI